MVSNGTTDSTTLLVTGGAGFIGSHTVLELLKLGYNIVVVDNCCNSYKSERLPESLKRVEKLTGREVAFHQLDITDLAQLRDIFTKYSLFGVMHFAGLKAVAESVARPLLYYQTNVVGAMNVLQCMKEFRVRNLIFSSSATVYGTPLALPIDEQHPAGQSCTNPYGLSKFFIEQIVTDFTKANPGFNAVLLRYFNPVGAHSSGMIGEDPAGLPNNLMPFVSQVASGKLPMLSVFGDDYPTPDGTGVRDYIHVVDLALGHVAALSKLREEAISRLKVYNLGTGMGYSVLQMVGAMEVASGKHIPYQVRGRRDGDVATVYAECSLAANELGWTATRDLETMCKN